MPKAAQLISPCNKSGNSGDEAVGGEAVGGEAAGSASVTKKGRAPVFHLLVRQAPNAAHLRFRFRPDVERSQAYPLFPAEDRPPTAAEGADHPGTGGDDRDAAQATTSVAVIVQREEPQHTTSLSV